MLIQVPSTWGACDGWVRCVGVGVGVGVGVCVCLGVAPGGVVRWCVCVCGVCGVCVVFVCVCVVFVSVCMCCL